MCAILPAHALLVDEPGLGARFDQRLDSAGSRRRWTWAASGGVAAGLVATATGVVADAGLLGIAGFALTVVTIDVLADQPAVKDRIGVVSVRLRDAIGVPPHDD